MIPKMKAPTMPDELDTPAAGPLLRYGHVLRAVSETPWAIMPETLAVIMDVLSFRAMGGQLTTAEIQARIGAEHDDKPPAARPASARPKAGGGAVAILGLRGLIAHRASAFNDVSTPQGTSVERFTQLFREAMANDDVSAILIDVQSPGGSIMGITELASEIRAARGTKPIVAVANAYAASAAYWIASAADEVVITPSGEVGSIGVYAAHQEFSKMDEMLGRKTTLISAGEFKVEGNPFEPLTEEAQAYIQELVNETYGVFIADIAKSRGVKVAAVRGGFGQGRMVRAKDAVAMGMADRVDTFDNTLSRLLTGRGRPRGRSAATAGRHFDFV